MNVSIDTLLGTSFHAAKVGMCLTDARGRVLAVNGEICRMFMMTEGEVIGHRFLIFVPKPDRRSATNAFQAVLREEFLNQPDWHVWLRDGGEMWVHVAPALVDLRGEPAVLSVLTDVTPSRVAEAARQQAEHKARGFVESNVMGVFEFSTEGPIAEANQAFLSMLGMSEAIFRSRTWNWRDLTPQEYLPADLQALTQLESEGRTKNYAKEFFRCDGSTIPVLIGLARSGSDASCAIAYVLDRTERKQAYVALEEGRETLRRVLDSALDAVIIADTHGVVTDWRGSAEHMFGWTSDEAVGKSLQDLIIPERYHEAHQRGIETYMKTGVGVVIGNSVEIEARCKNGQEIPVELMIAAITSAGKGRFCAFVRDLTERRKSEEQARDINAELERRVEERTGALEAAYGELESFSYSVSHDLRAPLRSIHGFTNIVLEDLGPEAAEETRSTLLRVTKAAERMSLLIDDLLLFARLSRAEVKVEPVDISSLLADVVSEVSQRSERGDTLVEIQPGMQTTADPSMLRFMLMNLIDNAFKYTSKIEAPHIQIGHETGKGFYIKDNGTGFDPNYAGKLFRPFERLHSPDDFPGTGIGLANVQRVVQRHGGRVWAESELGCGATFYFTLGPQKS